MNAAGLQKGILAFVIVTVSVLYIPYAEDPFRSFRETALQTACAGLALVWIYRFFCGAETRWREGFGNDSATRYAAWFFLASCAAFVASLFINGANPAGAVTAVNFMAGGILFASFHSAIGPANARKWIFLFLAAAGVNAALGIMQYAGYDPFFNSLDPAFHSVYRKYLVAGFLDTPNLLAPFLASFIPYLFHRFVAGETMARATVAACAIALLFVPLAMTRNFAAFAGLAAVMAGLLAYYSARALRGGGRWRLLAAWGVAAAVAVTAFQQYAKEDEISRIIKQYSMDERKTQNRAALMMFGESPLTGKGPGYFYRHFVEYRRAVWFQNPPLRVPDRAAHQAHNDYAQMLAEGGLLTLLPLLAILAVWFFSQARYLWGTVGKPFAPHDAAVIGGGGGFWILAINALGSFPFHVATLAVVALFWAAMSAKMIKYGAHE